MDWSKFLKSIYGKAAKAVERQLALMAFRRRQRARSARIYPVRWLAQTKLMADDLALIRDEDGAAAVDDKFLDQLLEAREKATSTATKYTAASGAAVVYLLLGAFAIDLQVSVAGVTLARAPGLNEILALFVVGTGAATAALYINIQLLGALIEATSALIHPSTTSYFYKVTFFPENPPYFFRPTYRPNLVWHPFKFLVSNFHMIILSVYVVTALAMLTASRYLIYTYIWQNPSLPDPWSHVIVAASLAIDISVVLFALSFLLPLPHRDYAVNELLDVWDFLDPEVAKRLRSEYYDEEARDRLDMEARGYLKRDEGKP